MAAKTVVANLPNLENYTPSGFVDEIGELRAQMKILEQREGILKEAFKGRFAEEYKTGLETDNYVYTRTPVEQVRVNSDLVKALLEKLIAEGKISAEDGATCFKEIKYDMMSIKPKAKPPV